jgi:HAD superfamily hydrolase (TIGR01509 family)
LDLRGAQGLVIFDCDGVLVDSEPIVNRVYVELMRERGFEINERHSLLAYSGTHMAARLSAYGRELSWEPDSTFAAEFYERLEHQLRSDLHPVEGVRTVLEALTTNPSVASNGTVPAVRERLRLTGLTEYFGPRIFSAIDMGAPKPAPDVFLAAAAHSGVPPAACVVVEDSTAGVRGGFAAGMTVLGYTAIADATSLRDAGATETFGHMDQLLDLLTIYR